MSDYETRMRQRQIGRDLLSQSQEAMGAAADVAVPMPEHASLISTYAKACVEATAPLIVAAELTEQAEALDQQAEALSGAPTNSAASGMVVVLRDLAEDFRGRASVLRGEGPTGVSDEELPGMWSNADLSGGQTDVAEGEQ